MKKDVLIMLNIVEVVYTLLLSLVYLNHPIKTLINYYSNGHADVSIKGGAKLSIKKGYGELSQLLKIIKRGWKVSNEGNDLIFVYKNKKIVQPNVGVLAEDIEGMYHFLITKEELF